MTSIIEPQIEYLEGGSDLRLPSIRSFLRFQRNNLTLDLCIPGIRQ